MSKTLMSDVIGDPVQFVGYVRQRSVDTCPLISSGIMVHDPMFAKMAGGGGRTVNMPFWRPRVPVRQILSDTVPLSVNRVGAGQDIASVHYEGEGWSANRLAGIMAGSDPLGGLTNEFGDHQVAMNTLTFMSSVMGACASPTMASNRLSIAKEAIADYPADRSNYLNALTFIDGTGLLGDRAAGLGFVLMHSVTEARLRKLDLIDTIPGSEGKAALRMFQGRIVLVDDRCPVRDGVTDGKVFTTFLLGKGAIAYGEADLTGEPAEGGHGNGQIEWERDAAAGDSSIFFRRQYILHPRGVAWMPPNEIAGLSPDDDEMATGQNWTRVYAPKEVPIVAMEHN